MCSTTVFCREQTTIIMDKNTVYILQKDLPDAYVGTEFTWDEDYGGYVYVDKTGSEDGCLMFSRNVENNPEWFKPKEEVNESKSTEKKQWEDEDDDFLWTNELVMEFVNFHDEQKGIHWLSEDIEKFKKSKSKKEEPQWEILEFKNLRSGIVYIKKDNGKFNSGNGLDWDLEKFDIKDHEIINSVKRFPDNTVWSVDMVTEHGIITAFKIVGSTMVAEIKNNIFPYDYPLYLSELKAPKEEQVPIKVHSLHHLGENSNDAATQIVTSHRIPPSKYQSIKSAIEDVLNSETLESIKKKYEDIIKEINREAAQKIFDINNNARNQFS